MAAPIWVFAGPSLPPSARPAGADLAWRAPAMAGDALLAAEARPQTVVLLDGLFDRTPAIKHKELLSLMQRGVRVIGGASMGALRAAELRTFGMIGVGRIYEAYVAGRLVADDEVALLHGPEELDWAALTLPLVNVRATLLHARRRRVVSLEAARALFGAARATFFQERTWATVIADVGPSRDADRFAAWVGEGYVDLKRLDALACLAAARSRVAATSRQVLAVETAFTRDLAHQVASGLRPSPGPSSPP